MWRSVCTLWVPYSSFYFQYAKFIILKITLKDCSPYRILLLELSWRTTTTCHLAISYVNCTAVQSRIEFKIACITYKVLTTGQPSYLSTLLNHYTPLRTLRSANQYLLQHPRVSTEFAKRSFSYLPPKIWNNIPVHIRLCSTLPTFKCDLKTYLFKYSIYTSLPPSFSPIATACASDSVCLLTLCALQMLVLL